MTGTKTFTSVCEQYVKEAFRTTLHISYLFLNPNELLLDLNARQHLLSLIKAAICSLPIINYNHISNCK